MSIFGRGRDRLVLAALHQIEQNTERIMTEVSQTQQDVNAATAAVTGLLDDIGAQVAQLATDLTALQGQIAAGQPVDTTALDTAVTRVTAVQQSLDDGVAAITALTTPPPPAGV